MLFLVGKGDENLDLPTALVAGYGVTVGGAFVPSSGSGGFLKTH